MVIFFTLKIFITNTTIASIATSGIVLTVEETVGIVSIYISFTISV